MNKETLTRAKAIKSIISLLTFLALFNSISIAQNGVVLPSGYVAQVKKVKCGYILGKWIQGSFLRNGNFLSIAERIKDLTQKSKVKNIKPAAKAKLLRQISTLKATQKTNAKSCKGLAAPQVSITPTATPTPIATPATPLPGATTVAWNVDAASLAMNLNGEYLYFCPGDPTISFRSIYGNDIYTTDSPICVSALHRGLFARSIGGNVKFKIKGSQSFFLGAVRNGVTSNFFSSYPTTYVFLDIDSAQELISTNTPEISWTQTAQPIYTYLESQFTFFCPSGVGLTRSIWGTDLYTYDSSICTAAVHAGKISVQQGGTVVIRIKPGASGYSGSARNGISSSNYGSWGGSYIFP